MRTSKDKLNTSLKKEIISTFFQTLEDLKDKKEIETFLTDFFSETELETYSKRLATAYWLKKKRTSENIKTNLKTSNTAITSVKKQLNTKGFKLALKKMEAEEWANVWSEKIKKLGNLH